MQLSVKQKVKYVFERYLTKLGWRSVYASGSGVLEKNGLVLFIYQTDAGFKDVTTGNGSIAAVYSEFSNISGASWRLECTGWLLDYGTLSMEFANIYEYAEKAVSFPKFNELVNLIDSYSLMTKEELSEYKKGYITVEKQQMSRVLETGGFSFKDTGMFIADVDKDPEIGKVFSAGVVYRLIDLEGSTGIFRTMNQSLDGFSRKAPFSFDCKVIMQLEKLQSIKAVKIVEKEVPHKMTELKNVIENSTVALPSCLEKFALHGVQRVAVAQALVKGLNYTPLLNNQLSSDACTSMLSLLEIDDRIGAILANVVLSGEQLNALEPYVRSGYSIRHMVESGASADFIRLNYADVQQGLTEYCENLRGYSPEAQQVIRHVKSFGQVSHVLFNEHPLLLLIRDEIFHGNFRNTGKYFQLEGLCLSDTLIKADWHSAPAEVKNEFRKLLNSQNFLFNGRPWEESLERIFENCMYIVYHARYGYLLRCAQFYVGFDYNSLIIFDITVKPVWRAVLINGEVLTDEKTHEDIIF